MLELGFRPLRAQALRFAEAASVSFWLAIVAVGTYAQFSLPAWQRGTPRPTGCYFVSSIVTSIECREIGADPLLETMLNYAWYWSWGVGWLMADFPYSLASPLNCLALVTLFFVLRFQLRHAPRIPE
jgi:hypothetical protein